MANTTLKTRREFLRVRGGNRHSTAAFLLEGRARTGADTSTGPRFGFIVTKKMGGAVVRNRMRRRLKAAVCELAPECANPTYDYVLLARQPASNRPFAALLRDLRTGFDRLHRQPRRARTTASAAPKRRP